MALKEKKITEAGISAHGVASAPDRLTGTAAENKKVFDNLVRAVVAEAVNGIVDELTGEGGAEQIGMSPIEGLAGENLPEALKGLKKQLDDAIIGAIEGGFVSFKEGEEPAARMKSFLYGKILADYREVNGDGN